MTGVWYDVCQDCKRIVSGRHGGKCPRCGSRKMKGQIREEEVREVKGG